jgi:hypothetical protein
VTVAGVSAGVALAATATPVPGGTEAQGAQRRGSPVTEASAATSRSATLDKEKARQAGARPSASLDRDRAGADAKRQPGHAGRTKTAPPASRASKPSKPSPRSTAEPAGPYQFYDSTDPQTVPAGAEVAVYADGPHPTPASAVAGRKDVLWIDIDGSDPQAQVLDVEPGCATPSQVPQWVQSRLTQVPGSVAIVYTMISEWSAVQSAVASLPEQDRSRIRWWIADPTGSPHVVPGSDATQWYWGSTYDISTALPDF